jgi:hypothetical protein
LGHAQTHAEILDRLDRVPPSWSERMDPAARFQLIWGGPSRVQPPPAVLDKETGLVWQRETGAGVIDFNWQLASQVCLNQTTGLRKGWRLPTAAEFGSLVDPTQSGPALPPGHPFLNVPSIALFWTATPVPKANGGLAYTFSTYDGDLVRTSTTFQEPVWCVRGGQID